MYKEKSKYSVRHLVFFLILIISGLNANCQNALTVNNTKNSIRLDAATAKFIGMYAVNYEREIFQLNNYKMSVNVGVGGWYLTTISKWYYGYSIPLSLNNLIGSGNNYFEIDLGMRYTSFADSSDKDGEPFFPIFDLGYRYQKPNGKGLIFRSFIGLSGVGIGIGKAF